MSVAVNHGAIFQPGLCAIIAMIIMVLLDLFLWRPVFSGPKFKQEETGAQFVTSSFFPELVKEGGFVAVGWRRC